jgi:hypothetical protein
VASVTQAQLIAAQGELPRRPWLDQRFTVVDLRNTQGEVGTLDYAEPKAPIWSVGRSVALADLTMSGLASVGADGQTLAKVLKARAVECPSCGAALEVSLDSTQSIVCHQCHAVVDVSQGVGGDLKHYAQANGSEPQIPLGSSGRFALGGAEVPWQVVGYAERCEVASDDDEQSFWREYLLYHREQGFAFLVDAEDGWSWAVPITGVPQARGDNVQHAGGLYRPLYRYASKTTYVLGEFYWKLERGQLTQHVDYRGTGAHASKRLNREETRSGAADTEVVWSWGETLTSEQVRRAFGLSTATAPALKRDALPATGDGGGLLAKLFFWGFVIAVIFIVARCDDDDCETLRDTYGASSLEYQQCRNAARSSGGSSGGYRSGGFHK